MEQINWSGVEAAGEIQSLPAGGYVCQLLRVTDKPEKKYLEIEFDIVEGPYKDYFTKFNAEMNFWAGKFNKSYKQTALKFFKGMLTAIEQSNPGFSADRFGGNERELERKFVGLTIGDEVYWNSKGEKKKRCYVDRITSVDKIRSGDFKIPEEKVNDYNKPANASEPADTLDDSEFHLLTEDDDVPF